MEELVVFLCLKAESKQLAGVWSSVLSAKWWGALELSQSQLTVHKDKRKNNVLMCFCY